MKMKINVDKSLIKAVKTGNVIVGAKRTVDAAADGSAKMVVLASNCPEEIKKKVQATNVPVLEYEGTSVELGPVCGKPFTIAAMSTEGDLAIIEARVPVAEMFGFAGEIRSATEGRAMWSTEFGGFDTVPTSIQNEIVGQIRERKGLKKELPKATDFLSM